MITDFRNAGLTGTQIILCKFAENLTINPSHFDNPQGIERLKSAGLSDQAILDATLVMAYFNFVNRIVQALGVKATARKYGGISRDIIKGILLPEGKDLFSFSRSQTGIFVSFQDML